MTSSAGTPVTVFPDPQQLAVALASEIAARLRVAPGRPPARLVLGCPAGRTPTPTFRALPRAIGTRADLSELVIVMMDEYLQDGAEPPRPVDPSLAHSCRGYAWRELVEPLNAGREPGRRVSADHVLLPDPADPEAFDRALAELGGVDLFILASGASDGHVGFHGPGADPDGGTRVVPLAASTRQDNLLTFPHLRTLKDVPRQGVSIGLGTVVRQSAQAVMVLTGSHKATSARRVLGAADYRSDWPATIIHRCSAPRILLDRAAAGEMFSR
ncbi:MAG TPA: 6-phosphogluconolactonase [Nakamurella sp.]|nr:6-phosphogluconolactonase [Nakamurella sp.]